MIKIAIFVLLGVIANSCSSNRLSRQTNTLGYYTIVDKSKVEGSYVVGYVKDRRTKNFLSSANITVEGHTELGTITNENGFFKIEVTPSNYQFTASNIGNTDLTTKSIKIRPNEKLEIHFYLGTFEIR